MLKRATVGRNATAPDMASAKKTMCRPAGEPLATLKQRSSCLPVAGKAVHVTAYEPPVTDTSLQLQ